MHAIRRLRSTPPQCFLGQCEPTARALMPGRGVGSAPFRAALPQAAPLEANACILAIAAHGDRTAFAALFGYFAPRVKSSLLRQGVPDALAEDLAQDTMLMVWRKAAQFDPRRAGAATWIFTIARNLRIDALRREQKLSQDAAVDADTPYGGPSAEFVLLADETEAALRAALRTLPPDQRQVVQMSFLRELAHGEIERELGIPLGTVKSRLRLAMARLRAALEQSR